MTPKTIQIYFKAHSEKRKTKIQDIWLAGLYVRAGVVSAFPFDKDKNPPEYPKMPFEEEVEKELVQDKEWVEAQRKRAYNHFALFLSNRKK